MSSPFHSSRLIFRAVEPAQDTEFYLSIQQDAAGYQNSNARIAVPQSTKDAERYMKYVAEETMLGLVICLPAATTTDAASDDTTKSNKPTPIGSIHLSPLKAAMAHHRFTEIGIDILPAYQGQGYGSEAIEWVLEWAFESAAMHRVSIQCFEYNDGARRLYERLGFKQEGISREMLWHKGRFWDNIHFGMLDREWREMRAKTVKNS